MKKFSTTGAQKKDNIFTTNKTATTKPKNTLHAVAKKKAEKFMSIFTYEYQESDLEVFVF